MGAAVTKKMTPNPSPALFAPYEAWSRWTAAPPRVLVVACSDGRIQKPLDEFLKSLMHFVQYDRLYVPGGPRALLATKAAEPNHMLEELQFLFKTHHVSEAVFVFHDATPDGPPDAICAGYSRSISGGIAIRAAQKRDATDLRRLVQTEEWSRDVRVWIVRAEVGRDEIVRFADLA